MLCRSNLASRPKTWNRGKPKAETWNRGKPEAETRNRGKPKAETGKRGKPKAETGNRGKPKTETGNRGTPESPLWPTCSNGPWSIWHPTAPEDHPRITKGLQGIPSEFPRIPRGLPRVTPVANIFKRTMVHLASHARWHTLNTRLLLYWF